MNIEISTPALLFPAVSLLLLAYTNRFLALASVIRRLHADYKAKPDPGYIIQIEKLRWRIWLVRNMQFCGVLSLLICTLCMFLLFCELRALAQVFFVLSILSMIVSLIFSLVEINISTQALDFHLRDLEGLGTTKSP